LLREDTCSKLGTDPSQSRKGKRRNRWEVDESDFDDQGRAHFHLGGLLVCEEQGSAGGGTFPAGQKFLANSFAAGG